MARCGAILLMLLILGAAALPAVQAQGISMYIFVFQSGSSNIAEEFRKTGSFKVSRLSLGASYGAEAHIRLCFSGSATLGQDYYVSSNTDRLYPSGNCVVDKFHSGDKGLRFYINPIEDSDDEANETVIVTLSQVPGSPFPSGYYLPSHYSRMNFRIIDND
ncbi:MAG: hypothetical protein OXT05_11425 [Chloroflexota bacterium]|nr:hypothetical protein [Chloroflexota bacterium]